MRLCCHVTVQNVDYMLSNLGDAFSERFQMAVDLQPRTSEWSPSLEILCMHSIQSDPYTSLHICIYEGGGVKAVWNLSKNSSDLVA